MQLPEWDGDYEVWQHGHQPLPVQVGRRCWCGAGASCCLLVLAGATEPCCALQLTNCAGLMCTCSQVAIAEREIQVLTAYIQQQESLARQLQQPQHGWVPRRGAPPAQQHEDGSAAAEANAGVLVVLPVVRWASKKVPKPLVMQPNSFEYKVAAGRLPPRG